MADPAEKTARLDLFKQQSTCQLYCTGIAAIPCDSLRPKLQTVHSKLNDYIRMTIDHLVHSNHSGGRLFTSYSPTFSHQQVIIFTTSTEHNCTMPNKVKEERLPPEAVNAICREYYTAIMKNSSLSVPGFLRLYQKTTGIEVNRSTFRSYLKRYKSQPEIPSPKPAATM